MAIQTACRKEITHSILFDCDKLPIKGFASDGVIVNRADIDFSAFTTVAPSAHVVSNFPMLNDKTGYEVQQPINDPYSGTQITMNEGTYYNTFNKELHLLIFGTDDTSRAEIADELANGEFVVILRKKEQDTTSYVIFGLDCGLKATEITQDFYDDDTKGAIAATLTETDSPVFGHYLYAGSVAATEALLTSLVTGN